jgi:hypothetical protein
MRSVQRTLAFALLAAAFGYLFTQQLNADPQDLYDLQNLNLSTLISRYKSSKTDLSAHERRWAGPPPAPASDSVWEAAKCKGRKFMAQMSYSDFDVGQILPVPQTTAQSPWYYGGFPHNSSPVPNDSSNNQLANAVIGHLSSWGYLISRVPEAYRNFETGGYWGIADFFRHIRISDKCVEEGGQWRATVITHYKPRLVEQDLPTAVQTYVGPDGHARRVRIHKTL